MSSVGRPRRLLLGAGPSNVPTPLLDALSMPTVGHLDPWFLDLADDVNRALRSVFQTSNPATFPVSGTGTAGMEMMLVNFLEPGDRLVVGVCGHFGERIAEAAERLGAEVVRVLAPAGEPVDLDELERAMKRGADALAIVHGETSTGVTQPLGGLDALVRERDALLLVDCVTSLSGHPLSVDEAGIDVAFSGTQKCLNCPPGLAPITIGERALERLAKRRVPVPSWCFDVNALLGYWEAGTRSYHHTPPINSIYALEEALAVVLFEGLEERWHRHHVANQALVAGLEQLGAEPLVAPDNRLWPLTTFKPPAGVDEALVRKALLERHGIEISGGLGELEGKVWRVGTMGANASLSCVSRLVEAIGAVLDPAGHGRAVEIVAETWHRGLVAPDLLATPVSAG
jgi:alanine-glyoxylate transaminase / serine-glyoxylate transaminase / serine-pyruvate transaminase